MLQTHPWLASFLWAQNSLQKVYSNIHSSLKKSGPTKNAHDRRPAKKKHMSISPAWDFIRCFPQHLKPPSTTNIWPES